jgi:hypothetical protein
MDVNPVVPKLRVPAPGTVAKPLRPMVTGDVLALSVDVPSWPIAEIPGTEEPLKNKLTPKK